MTTTYVWSELRDRAVQGFGGELPGAAPENAVIEVFERHPALVLATIEAVSEAKAQGRVRSGWAILRSRLEADETKAETFATDASDRRKRIARAEQWIHAAGKHFDRASEILEELFDGLGGDRSEPLLKPWRSDEGLRERMVTLWREVRSEGELIEQQAIERAERWKATVGLRWKLDRDPKFREQYLAAHPEYDDDPEPSLEDDLEPALV